LDVQRAGMLTVCSLLVRMVSPTVAVLVVEYGGLEGRGLASMACQMAVPRLARWMQGLVAPGRDLRCRIVAKCRVGFIRVLELSD
jgi:hypothetical protein